VNYRYNKKALSLAASFLSTKEDMVIAKWIKVNLRFIFFSQFM